jgi:hypothetical protein
VFQLEGLASKRCNKVGDCVIFTLDRKASNLATPHGGHMQRYRGDTCSVRRQPAADYNQRCSLCTPEHLNREDRPVKERRRPEFWGV